MKGKRTGVDFSKHVIEITQSDGLLVHYFRKPNTIQDGIKFINTNGILAVTGDYSDWLFCREFRPSAEGHVSDMYWLEKLKNSSCQEPYNYDGNATREEIQSLLNDEDEELDEKEKEYLTDLLDYTHDELEYKYHAYRDNHNCGRFENAEDVPFCKEVKIQLLIVFDAFDEMCRRMADGK